ncbi:MAG TPA: MFS transporter [Chloroflexota bacterium]|nr:MFS transporter [Chloroflexota bacterium]
MPRWQRTLYVMAVAQAFSILGFSFVIPFLPLYVQQLGIHGAARVTLWSAFLAGCTAVGMGFAAPIWGALADRYGRKIMVVRASFSAAVLVGLMGLATNVYQLLALRLLQGMFTGTVSASQALVSSQTPRDRLGFALGLMQTAIFVGNSSGPLLGGLVAQWVGFRASFGFAALFLMTCAALVVFFVHEEPRFAEPSNAPRPRLLSGLRETLTAPALLAMIAALFAVQFAVTQVYPIIPQLVQVLQGRSGHAALVTGAILAGAGAAGALSSTAVGWFSDRIGHKTILVIAACAACTISIPQAFVTATWQLAVLRVADGFALGAMLPSASAMLAGMVRPERRGAAYGLAGSANSIGIAAGPLTSAAVVAVSGIREVFFTAAVVLGIVALWVGTMVHPEAGAGTTTTSGVSTTEQRGQTG